MFLVVCLVLVTGGRTWNRHKAIAEEVLRGLEDEQQGESVGSEQTHQEIFIN